MRMMQGRQGFDAMIEARAASDQRLTFSLVDSPPPALTDPFAERQAAFSAQRLDLPADAVRIIDTGSRLGRVRFGERGPPERPPGDFGGPPPGSGGAGPASPGNVRPPLASAGSPGPDAFAGLGGRGPGFGPNGQGGIRDGRGGVRRGAFLGRRSLAIRLDGRWLVVRGPQPSEDAL